MLVQVIWEADEKRGPAVPKIYEGQQHLWEEYGKVGLREAKKRMDRRVLDCSNSFKRSEF